MSKITPCLWFDFEAEEAVAHYIAIFGEGSVRSVVRYGADQHGPEGAVMTVAFELHGQPFLALNGGPHYKFTPAISFMVDCADKAEIDHYAERLAEGGAPGRGGWLTDKFGVSWQIVAGAMPKS